MSSFHVTVLYWFYQLAGNSSSIIYQSLIKKWYHDLNNFHNVYVLHYVIYYVILLYDTYTTYYVILLYYTRLYRILLNYYTVYYVSYLILNHNVCTILYYIMLIWYIDTCTSLYYIIAVKHGILLLLNHIILAWCTLFTDLLMLLITLLSLYHVSKCFCIVYIYILFLF